MLVDPDVPARNQNELKSALISAFASHGKWADALSIYEDMKKDECLVEPKSIISLIVSMQFQSHSLSLYHIYWLIDNTDMNIFVGILWFKRRVEYAGSTGWWPTRW